MYQILKNSIHQSMDYQSFKSIVNEIAHENDHPKQHVHLSNLEMMNQQENEIEIPQSVIEQIKHLKNDVLWMVIGESWCPDTARNLPIIYKMSLFNDLIELKIVLRDQNKDFMNLFLTNGGQAIFKLIQFSPELEVKNTWGPRPSQATEKVMSYKSKHGQLTTDFKSKLKVWCDDNKGQNTISDLYTMLMEFS